MKMHKIAMAVSVAVLGLSGVAQAELSANVGATSNYIWRGVSQTGDNAAISGGIDYAHDSGLYAGTWVSTLGNGNGEELDLYGGFGGEMSSVGYDVGVIYYAYPSLNDSNFAELYGSASLSNFTVGLNYTVSGQNDGGTFDDGDLYYYASASFDLDDGWSVGGTIGHYSFDKVSSADYSHVQLDVTKSAGDYGDVTFSLSDVFDEDTAGTYDNDLIPMISWSKSF